MTGGKMMWWSICVALLWAALATLRSGASLRSTRARAELPLAIGDRRQVFIDGQFIEQSHGVQLVVHKPYKTGPYQIFGDTEAAVKIKNLKLEGNRATFNMDMGSADQPFRIEFKGTLDRAALSGQFTSSRGDSEVTGKKTDETSALVGTWQFTGETSWRMRTSTLKILVPPRNL